MTDADKNSEFEFIQGLTADLSSPSLVFPTSLNTTMNIRRAILHDKLSNDTLARIIGTEPVLSAQVLKLSNSPLFNPTGKVNNDLKTATMRLGYVKLRNLTIAVGMKQLTEYRGLNQEVAGLMEGLWSRSIRVAIFSHVLARHGTRLNPDDAMLAGLLHDVGKFYILNRAAHYRALFSTQRALWALVDAWHSNIGAAILENWEIAEDIRDAVRNFGDRQAINRTTVDLTDMIYAADLLDAHYDERSSRKLNWEDPPPVLQRLKLDEAGCNALHEAMQAELSEFLSAIA